MKYQHYLKVTLPEEQCSSGVVRLLDCLRYAQVIGVDENSFTIPKPDGLLVEPWLKNNIARMASFGLTAVARKRLK